MTAMSPDTATQNLDYVDEKLVESPDSPHSAPAGAGPETPPETPSESPSDIVGYIDSIAGDRAYGWALDRSRPEEKLVVEISLDNEPVATVCADEFRDHLKQGGIGDGAHGFAVQLPERLSKEERHRVTAVVREPGYGGVTRLKNQAAINTDALALRPSDFNALVGQIEQCVDDQRAGFRWIYHELHALDEFVRNDTKSLPTIETAPGSDAADEVTDALCAIESQFSELVQNQTVIQDSLEEMSTLQKTLNQRLEQLDVFNARIDARLEGLQTAQTAEPEIADDQRGLKKLVIFLGCLTIASLVTGIAALFA